MTITKTTNAMSARKSALDFHIRNKIKSINDLEPFSMQWSDLNSLEADAKRAASKLLDETNDDTLMKLEPAVDAFTDLLNEIRNEKDERGSIDDKGPRAQHETKERLDKRPMSAATWASGVDDGEQRNHAQTSNKWSIKPEARMTTFAQARSNDEYRGLEVGDMLRSMVTGANTDQERRALAEGTDSAGGFTVPTVLSGQLIDKLRAVSTVVRAGARTVPMTSDSLSFAKLLTDPVPAWRLENAAVNESDPTFGQVAFAPKSLAVLVKVSQELMEDSVNIASELPNILAAALAVELDRVALLGSGSAPEPTGIANTANIGTSALDTLLSSYAPMLTARTGILSANAGNPTAIIMHPRDEGSITGLLDSTGQPLNAPAVLDNTPMLTTTSIPIDGGTGSDESTIFVGDFTKLLIGMRQSIRVEVLKERYADNMQYGLICHLRADIAVEHAAAFHTITGVGNVA